MLFPLFTPQTNQINLGLLGSRRRSLLDVSSPLQNTIRHAVPLAHQTQLAPVPQIPQQQGPSIWQRLLGGVGQAIGGRDDERLDYSQNLQARRDAILQAGLALMAAQPGQSTLGNIAHAIAAGRETGAQVRTTAMQEAAQKDALEKQKQVQQMILSASPEQQGQLVRQLLAAGQTQHANAVISLINATKPPQVQERNPVDFQRFTGKDGKLYVMNPETRAVEPLLGPDGQHMEAQPQSALFPNYSFIPTTGGIVAGNSRTGTVTPVEAPGGGSLQGGAPDKRIHEIQPAFDALNNYGELVKEFMGLDPLDRAKAVAGRGNQGLLGRVEAAQKTVLLQMKNLAELGVLTGPDVGIIEGMIGNPTSLKSLIRDPEYVTSRLPEARKLIEGKSRAFQPQQSTTGGARVPGMESISSGGNVQNPAAGKNNPLFTPTTPADVERANQLDGMGKNSGKPAAGWQARARQLQAQGKTQSEIIETLRREGLIR
jgi:hypothetical protein